MKASCSMFSQILKLIPRTDFERIVNPARMVLDLRVQPGGAAAAQPLIQYGAKNNVTVIIKEFK